MTRMDVAKIPDQAENRRRFAQLELADRRRIIRAVNRGEALEERRLAILAVGIARRQQRFWKRSWLLGPAIGVLQPLFPDVTIIAAVINTAVTTALLVMLSRFWHRRAKQSEERNLARLGGPRSTRGQASGGSDRPRLRRHLPGRGAAPDDGAGTEDGEAASGGQTAQTHRPHRPRGRKRR